MSVGLHRQPALLHPRREEHERRRWHAGQGLRLVRQRVGLRVALRRPAAVRRRADCKAPMNKMTVRDLADGAAARQARARARGLQRPARRRRQRHRRHAHPRRAADDRAAARARRARRAALAPRPAEGQAGAEVLARSRWRSGSASCCRRARSIFVESTDSGRGAARRRTTLKPGEVAAAREHALPRRRGEERRAPVARARGARRLLRERCVRRGAPRARVDRGRRAATSSPRSPGC